MLDKQILKRSFIHAALAVLYIAFVATFMQNLPKIFGPGPDGDSMVVPLIFLLVFVVSAATMGLLVFGKPVMLYIDGKKREAVTMVLCTIGTLAFITVLLIVILALSRG